MATQVTDTPFGLAFQENLKKEPRIVDMEIHLSRSKVSITRNAVIIQLFNIS